jgi:cytochrome c oxidase subunit 3
MTSHTSPHAQHYFVPQPSPYPFILSGGMFLLALGFILKMNAFARRLPGSCSRLPRSSCSWPTTGSARSSARTRAAPTSEWEDKSFRYGMIWFIASEVAFFAAFFGALFYVRNISVPALAGMDPAFTLWKDFTAVWPSAGPKGPAFTPMGAWGLPALNTALLTVPVLP